MMPNITRGGNTKGLMAYLVGPGRANEHENPHVVAGDFLMESRWANQELSHDAAMRMGSQLDTMMDTHNVKSIGNVHKYDKRTGERFLAGRKPNHVWHCSLSLPPDEGPLSEEQWNQIAHEFMDEMGFTEASGKAPCRWVAVHHGSSKNGGDHIHIVANIVREDGTKWYQNLDWPMAQRVSNQLEHKYGLRVVESREHNRSAQADPATALNDAAKRGEKLTDRQQLETKMRAAATAAGNERQYVELLTRSGVRVKPRFASGRTDVVTGYSVALHTRPGQTTLWMGANNVARDLNLTRLRERWPSTPQGATEAVQAWTEHWNSGQQQRSLDRLNASMDQWHGNAIGLTITLEELGKIDPTNPQALADATSDVSGLLATMAARHDGSRMGDAFDFTARQIGKHAQLKHRPQVANPTPTWLTLAGQLMMTAAMTSGSRSNELVIFMQAIQLTVTLADLYRQVQQTNTANLIERDTKALYDQIHRQFTPAENQLLQELAGYQVPLQQENLPPVPPPPAPDGAVIQEAQAILETDQPLTVSVSAPTPDSNNSEAAEQQLPVPSGFESSRIQAIIQAAHTGTTPKSGSAQTDGQKTASPQQPAPPVFGQRRIQAIIQAAHTGTASSADNASKASGKKPPLPQPGQTQKPKRIQ